MKVQEAYELLRQREQCSMNVRLEAHEAKLSNLGGCGELARANIAYDAMADICKALVILLGERGE